jgi:hypothetical protein
MNHGVNCQCEHCYPEPEPCETCGYRAQKVIGYWVPTHWPGCPWLRATQEVAP